MIKIIVYLFIEVFVISGLADVILAIRLFKLNDFASRKELSKAFNDALDKKNEDVAKIRKANFSYLPLLNFYTLYKTLNFCFMKNDEMLAWFLSETNL